MPLFINFNGNIYPEGSKLLDIGNRGFRYGDGLFESMRLMRGQLNFAEHHAERLQKGMKALHFEGYSQMDAWFLRERVDELAVSNKTKNGRVRLTVYRDAGGLYTPGTNKMAYSIELGPVDEPRYTLNDRGLIMDMYTEIPKPVNVLSNFKTCNAMIYVMAGLFKTRHLLDEVFILNQHSFLCEALSANVFVLYQGHLYTPALTEGCIAGVMRQVIIDLAHKIGVPVTEAQISPAILNQAEEVFLTNASRGIQWVLGYAEKRYFNQMSKFLIDELNKLHP